MRIGRGSGFIRDQPIRLPGLPPGVCSGLILSGAFYHDLKIGIWRRRTYQLNTAVHFHMEGDFLHLHLKNDTVR